MKKRRKGLIILGLIMVYFHSPILLSPRGTLIWIRRLEDDFYLHKWKSGRVILPRRDIDVEEYTNSLEAVFLRMYKPKEGDVVLDLGAGIGTELFLFSELVGKTGRVIAVEPDPQAFEYLRRLTQFLNFKNVTLVNVAVGVQNGTVQLAQNGHLGLESTLANMTHSSSVTVPVLTLPRLIQDQKLESVDFAKVNIEGAEKQLLGDKDTVSKVLNWCISCHDFTGHPEQRSKAHVIEALIAQGFRVETGFDFQSSAWALDYVYAQRTRL